jgi:hypothetical protein
MVSAAGKEESMIVEYIRYRLDPSQKRDSRPSSARQAIRRGLPATAVRASEGGMRQSQANAFLAEARRAWHDHVPHLLARWLFQR